MNASYSSESLVKPAATDRAQGSRQAPSVPISVYRELATELKATQALVDSLTQQNQQLGQQNLFLRQEMLKFADSAAHLKQVVDGQPTASDAPPAAYSLQPIAVEPPRSATLSDSTAAMDLTEESRSLDNPLAGVSHLTDHMAQIFSPKAKAAKAPSKAKAAQPKMKRPQHQMLYTEERLDLNRPGQSRERHADLSGLWLAATILLIVVSAFGAGFLIMRPLLNGSR
ncbi:MAG: hypothetical protein ACHWZW_20255 [Spirulina sp.]